MAQGDVKVREIRLLESYKKTFNDFMSSTVAMTYRYRTIVQGQDDEARDYNHKIKDTTELIRQRYIRAKNESEYAIKSGSGRDIEHRQRELEYYKKLYEKAQNYEETSKKLYDRIHSETERMIMLTTLFRTKIENSRTEGTRFLEKAIQTLNDYKDNG